MSESDESRDGRSIADLMLQGQVDSIQGEIDRLWVINDKDLESIHRKGLESQLKQAKAALAWVRGKGSDT